MWSRPRIQPRRKRQACSPRRRLVIGHVHHHEPMTVQVVWGATPDELDGDLLVVERATGLQRADLDRLATPPGVRLDTGHASVGKGASGSGVALVFEVVEHVI